MAGSTKFGIKNLEDYRILVIFRNFADFLSTWLWLGYIKFGLFDWHDESIMAAEI